MQFTNQLQVTRYRPKCDGVGHPKPAFLWVSGHPRHPVAAPLPLKLSAIFLLSVNLDNWNFLSCCLTIFSRVYQFWSIYLNICVNCVTFTSKTRKFYQFNSVYFEIYFTNTFVRTQIASCDVKLNKTILSVFVLRLSHFHTLLFAIVCCTAGADHTTSESPFVEKCPVLQC